MSKVNDMKLISLEKVVINIGVGKSGEPLERAKNALEELTSRKPTQCGAKDNVRDFGIHKGEPIGAKVTLRNTEADVPGLRGRVRRRHPGPGRRADARPRRADPADAGDDAAARRLGELEPRQGRRAPHGRRRARPDAVRPAAQRSMR